jgi:hypothetical protein
MVANSIAFYRQIVIIAAFLMLAQGRFVLLSDKKNTSKIMFRFQLEHFFSFVQDYFFRILG